MHYSGVSDQDTSVPGAACWSADCSEGFLLRGFSGELLRQESTGEQAIKDLTAAALEKEKKKK